ncbi:MAG: DNA adenine methylase [Bacteroidetes bacterium]|nr:DNA adenine methylase [Bacteroidota bacterium]
MKTPIKYWGGKQQLASKLIALFPRHACYVEPFFGGGAVFFEKPKAKVEIINDVNDNLVGFCAYIFSNSATNQFSNNALTLAYNHRL